jgi:glycerol-3-phosphate dehydrogenase subunit C
MTITYDPTHPLFRDEADVRDELARVFDVCHGCRRCVSLCGTFPTLFELMEHRDEPDAGLMTPAEQDRVVETCFQCKACETACPYTPERHELAVDFPRLMLRARAMQFENGHTTARQRFTTRVVARAGRLGSVATAGAPLVNAVIAAKPGSLIRRVVASLTGISARRLLPSYATHRFSAWFDQRPKITLRKKQGSVTVFPTCLVEYQAVEIGHDLVKVYERNGVECSRTEVGCCGAPWLHAGDVERFTKIAEKNVEILAREVRAGTDVVVAQPKCSYIVKQDYPDYVGGDDAELVAAHTYEASGYLMTLYRAGNYVLDTDFNGEAPRTITYHAPSYIAAQQSGFRGRDLMKLTGAKVTLVRQCSGVETAWGYRSEHEDLSLPIARRLGEQIEAAGGEVVAGDCHFGNTAIREQTGRWAVHPLQVIARAYGLPEES